MALIYADALCEEMQNQATFLVQDFMIRKSLNKAGFKTELSELDPFEAETMAFISACFSEQEEKEIKRAK